MAANEEDRLLALLAQKTHTVPLPIRNQAISRLEKRGVISVSKPYAHRRYQVVDIALKDPSHG